MYIRLSHRFSEVFPKVHFRIYNQVGYSERKLSLDLNTIIPLGKTFILKAQSKIYLNLSFLFLKTCEDNIF